MEMKSSNISQAASQIISTKEHIEKLLYDECNPLPEECHSDCWKQIAHITWKACLYHHGASPDEIREIQKELRSHGFTDIDSLTSADNDLRPLLSGMGRSAKEMSKRFKGSRRR